MKRKMLVAALVAIGLAGCGKEEQPKPALAPAAPIISTPATVPAPADAAKDAAKSSTEVPKAEAPKTEAGEDAKK